MENRTTYYSNSVQVAMQLFDVVMEFSVSSPDNSKEDQLKVFMSPQHVKVFAQILNEHVKGYEETFGPIPTPPSPEKIRELEERGIVHVGERDVNL